MHTMLEWYPDIQHQQDFILHVDACEVTYFEAPADIELHYRIGETPTIFTFVFAQSPCSWEATYTATLLDGSNIPDFIALNDR